MILSLFNRITALVPHVVTLARPPSYSSLKVNNRSFLYMPHLDCRERTHHAGATIALSEKETP